MDSLDPSATAAASRVPPAAPCVLVVEDEGFLATLIGNILVTAGYRVVKAVRVDEALALLRGGQAVDAALLDINVNGVEVFPVAAELQARGVPLVFASAYGRESLPPAFAHCAVVQKPYLPDSLRAAVAACLAAAAA